MTTKEYVIQELESFSEVELQEVADYLAFLKFRARARSIPAFDPEQAAALYAQFADEDRELAEIGLEDYNASLLTEDTR